MTHVAQKFTKGEVNKAGAILKAERPYLVDGQVDMEAIRQSMWADEVLANWRACHTYPINTFQATLRLKLRSIDKDALVAQRLKRRPSIVSKLKRFDRMELARMQDIGGLRAILGSVRKVRQLERAYHFTHFAHKLVSSKDYIERPKADGYRGIHLIYRYFNKNNPVYNGLSIELQFRTKLQHAWATAVETMGTFLGIALKSGEGEAPWRRFFTVASAALSIVEKTAAVPGYENRSADEICRELAQLEGELHVIEKLRSFAIAANQIHTREGSGAYHLIVLHSATKSVSITPYPSSRMDEAQNAYSLYEKLSLAGAPTEAVLVSAGPLNTLRKAYPNYFLDTAAFIRQIEKMIEPYMVGPLSRPRVRRSTSSRNL